MEPAAEEDVAVLAQQLNGRVCELIDDPRSRQWFKLFKHMDDDGSGRISYKELLGMIREELMLKPADLPEARIKAVWKALWNTVGRLLSFEHQPRCGRRCGRRCGILWADS